LIIREGSAMSELFDKHDTVPKQNVSSIQDSEKFLSDTQLRSEIEKCEYCREKPCKHACPCDCSPADFIRAVQVHERPDYLRAAALIMGKNPLGGICGQTCPEKHCMAACVHKDFDGPVNIPAVQASIIEIAKRLKVMPKFAAAHQNGKKIAVVGAGPAGLAAASTLVQLGYQATIFERENRAGGMCNLIPDYRLDKEVLHSDIEWNLHFNGITLELNRTIEDPSALLKEGFAAVVSCNGLWKPVLPDIPNINYAIAGIPYLKNPDNYPLKGHIAVIGGGATAFDCAMTALLRGAGQVELFALENISEMPLAGKEMAELIRSGIDINGRIRIKGIKTRNRKISALVTQKVKIKDQESFSPGNVVGIPGSESIRDDIDAVIFAIGAEPQFKHPPQESVFFGGDCIEGPTTVVEASAAGKNVAVQVDAYLNRKNIPEFTRNTNGFVKSTVQIPGYNFHPVRLETQFFGRTLRSPFLLSASPLTDGIDQVNRAYQSGWAGVVMKTAFDNVPVHIPTEYMYKFDDSTFANCDNVSGHPLDRVCKEIAKLTHDYPDRITIASTGGPLTGNDANDRAVWQNNTRKLEEAGAMAIEFSLSCPQGGDGTEGDIAAQNALLTQKIIRWILESGDRHIPKIFKMTGAVTSIEAIGQAVKEVFAEFPEKSAGITLANTFPTMAFRKSDKHWDEGVVVGMSGSGVLNISYLMLAKAASLGLNISGNGGVMNYREAANFLALGCQTVQFCSLPTKLGYEIIDDLESGLSHMLADHGITSVQNLVGIALPRPIRDFMDLPADKHISQVDKNLCVRCGNCLRCPYLAIEWDPQGYPQSKADYCIGCKMCNYLCFTGAMSMRERTVKERHVLKQY